MVKNKKTFVEEAYGIDLVKTKEWFKQSDEDDRVYAQELLDAFARELQVHAQELRVEAEMQMLEAFDEALKVISKAKNA